MAIAACVKSYKLLFLITFLILLTTIILYLSNRNPEAKYDYVNTFTKIYATEEWGIGSGSGYGSNPKYAGPYLQLLQDLFNDPRFTKIVDLGCGDWQLMRNIRIPSNKHYLGLDVVQDIIASNNKNYANDNVQFLQTTDIRDLESQPPGDLLIAKDVLQHWPKSEIKYFIERILPKYKYALITNKYVEHSRTHNKGTKIGPTRSIGLLQKPYSLKNAKVVLEYYGPEHKQVIFYERPN